MVLILKKKGGKKQLKNLQTQLEDLASKGVDTKKFCGVIKLKEDPLDIQKKMRDEWK